MRHSASFFFANTWNQFLAELPSLSKIAFIRHINTRDYRDIKLIGFGDASQLGYAVMVYIRVVSSSEKVQVHLFTKVAPLKNSDKDMTLMIPPKLTTVPPRGY